MAPQPKIAIIGAGPAGLTLARILHTASIQVTVYEGDASPTARTQGGTLDLHPRTGQAALKAAKLTAEFEANCRLEGEDMVLADRHGTRFIEMKDMDTGRPEIDRTVLRTILLNSLPSDTVKWGQHLRSASVDPITGKGSLSFSDGTVVDDLDLIVGADGAWSKIRPLVTPVRPFYSGISGVEIRLRDIDSKHPDLARLVGNGSLFAFGEEEGRCLLCQRNGDGSVRIYAVGWKPEGWCEASGLGKGDAEADRQLLLGEYADWAPELRELIAQCDDDIITRALYMLPPGLRWASKKGITLVGDSFQLMTPFAGEGVNAAMAGAMKLAESIIRSPEDLERAVEDYERWMFPFAKKLTTETWERLLERFQRNGTRQMADHIKGKMAERDAMIAAAKEKGDEPAHEQGEKSQSGKAAVVPAS